MKFKVGIPTISLDEKPIFNLTVALRAECGGEHLDLKA